MLQRLHDEAPSDPFTLGWLMGSLRKRIGVLVVELNARQMRGFGASRAELFAEIDSPKLGELPDQPYVFARWKRCRVAPDYHVEPSLIQEPG